MSTPMRSESEIYDLERWVRLRKAAPRMLDAMRLIYFAVTHDHDTCEQRAHSVKLLALAALRETEDI